MKFISFYINRDNIKASIKNRPNFKDTGHFEPWTLDTTQRFSEYIYGYGILDWWPKFSYNRTTSETFGIIPLRPHNEWENVTPESVSHYPPQLSFLAQRMKSRVPYHGVATDVEKSLFRNSISRYIGATMSTPLSKATKVDFEMMAKDWNAGTLKQDDGSSVSTAPGIYSEKNIVTRKLAYHLEKYFAVIKFIT